MLWVRRTILEADDRVEESIKWSAPTFEYQGNLASFQPKAKRFLSLMFHRGSEIPGSHPDLEGDFPLVRTMKFTDELDARAKREALQRIVRSWCNSKDVWVRRASADGMRLGRPHWKVCGAGCKPTLLSRAPAPGGERSVPRPMAPIKMLP
jgi:hypothetical protein